MIGEEGGCLNSQNFNFIIFISSFFVLCALTSIFQEFKTYFFIFRSTTTFELKFDSFFGKTPDFLYKKVGIIYFLREQ